jgi:hypothetical protein
MRLAIRSTFIVAVALLACFSLAADPSHGQQGYWVPSRLSQLAQYCESLAFRHTWFLRSSRNDTTGADSDSPSRFGFLTK